MPHRPHSVVDYTNDAPFVDDEHYISLQLQNEDEDDDSEYNENGDIGVTEIRQPSSIFDSNRTDSDRRNAADFFRPNNRHNENSTSGIINGDYYFNQTTSGYENFDVRAPVWGPSKRQAIILSTCGAVSIVVGVLCCMCGILDFILESYAIESSFQVESKFSMIILVFSGLASCKTASRLRATSVACLMAFSLMAVGAAVSDSLMQALNWHYVRNDMENAIDTAIFIFSSIGGVTAMIQLYVTLRITSTAIDNRIWQTNTVSATSTENVVSKRRKNIFLASAFVQAVSGIIISCFMVAIYATLEADALENENATVNMTKIDIGHRRKQEIKWTLSSEMINHGWLISVAGVSAALALVQPTRWTHLVALGLQGTALVTTACNYIHPLTHLYAVTSLRDRSAQLSVAQLIFYILVLILCTGSFITLIKRLSGDGQALTAAIRQTIEKRGWALYRHTALIQLSIATLYVLIWISGFGERFLYLLDFSPLPVLILIHMCLSHVLTSTFSAPLLIVNLTWAFLCGLYAIRDMYLFDYHQVVKDAPDRAPPKWFNESFAAAMPTVTKLGVHLLLTACAFMEFVLSAVLIYIYVRTLSQTIGVIIPNKLQHKFTLGILSIFGALQLACGALIVNFGLVLFFSSLFTVTYLGDVCTFLGLLTLGTGVWTFLSFRWTAVALPLAAVCNALSCVVFWQHLDGNALLMSRITYYYENHIEGEHNRAYVFSAVVFALCFVCQLLSGFALIGLEDVLIDSKFDSSVRVEMIVQNTNGDRRRASTEQDDLMLRNMNRSDEETR